MCDESLRDKIRYTIYVIPYNVMKKFKAACKKMHCDPLYFGATVLRLAFAFLFILVAVKKFRMGYGGFADSIVSADNLLAKEVPSFLLYIYGYLLPAAELVAGLLLLFNKYTKAAYIIIATIYLSFIFGQEYNGNTSKVGNEYLPAMIALVLSYYLTHKVEEAKK